MSGEKRAADQSFGSTQLVKRQRSNGDMNGALIQSNGVVSTFIGTARDQTMLKRHGKGALADQDG